MTIFPKRLTALQYLRCGAVMAGFKTSGQAFSPRLEDIGRPGGTTGKPGRKSEAVVRSGCNHM
jgi:hypothetical protein